MSQANKSGGAKKIGRNGSMCKVYRDRDVRMRNKIRKVKRHVAAITKRGIGPDRQAQAWLDAI